MNFKLIEMQDRDWIEMRLKQEDSRACEYSFFNLYIAREEYDVQVVDEAGFLCIRVKAENDGHTYLYPAGCGDLKQIFRLLMKDAKERKIPFTMRTVTEDKIANLKKLFPDKFRYDKLNGVSDYLYTTEKLINLPGAKLSDKRRRIRRFMENTDWNYEKITEQNISECIQMHLKWCELNEYKADRYLKEDNEITKKILPDFQIYRLFGGLLRLNGEVIAFWMGQTINSDTFVSYIEKGYADVYGGYAMMCYEFVKNECSHLKYINRTQDLNEENMKKMKMSYDPDIILDKYKVREISFQDRIYRKLYHIKKRIQKQKSTNL